MLAGGVAVYATNNYVTTSALPSAVADIGGEAYYAWTISVFLLASVVSSMLVGPALAARGPRGSYVAGFAIFAVGSLVGALAPTMPVFLVGRAVQGFGGGLLTGLAYAVVRMALPAGLWPRAVALVSAMWGVGNVAGPILGGLFAQLGVWRGAFVTMTVAASALGVTAQRSVPVDADEPVRAVEVPWAGLGLVAASTVLVSIAGLLHSPVTIAAVAAAGLAVLVGFVAVDRRVRATVLPRFTYSRRSSLPWFYLGIAAVTIGGTTETFVPLFGQRLGGMEPFVAGLLGAAISWGWSIASILATSVRDRRAVSTLEVVGPVVLAVGLLGYGFAQRYDPSAVVIVVWFVTLVIAGCGIGMAFAHYVTEAISSTDDEADAARASAGVNTVQLIANTTGAAFAGLLVAVGGPSLVGGARALTIGFALVAVAGVVSARTAIAARGH